MVWGRARTREEQVATFADWLDNTTSDNRLLPVSEILVILLSAPDCGGIGLRLRQLITDIPRDRAVTPMTLCAILDQLDRELASERFLKSADDIKKRFREQ